ncbi:hypothetical protein ABK040_016278 [Willaertia magna]
MSKNLSSLRSKITGGRKRLSGLFGTTASTFESATYSRSCSNMNENNNNTEEGGNMRRITISCSEFDDNPQPLTSSTSLKSGDEDDDKQYLSNNTSSPLKTDDYDNENHNLNDSPLGDCNNNNTSPNKNELSNNKNANLLEMDQQQTKTAKNKNLGQENNILLEENKESTILTTTTCIQESNNLLKDSSTLPVTTTTAIYSPSSTSPNTTFINNEQDNMKESKLSLTSSNSISGSSKYKGISSEDIKRNNQQQEESPRSSYSSSNSSTTTATTQTSSSTISSPTISGNTINNNPTITTTTNNPTVDYGVPFGGVSMIPKSRFQGISSKDLNKSTVNNNNQQKSKGSILVTTSTSASSSSPNMFNNSPTTAPINHSNSTTSLNTANNTNTINNNNAPPKSSVIQSTSAGNLNVTKEKPRISQDRTSISSNSSYNSTMNGSSTTKTKSKSTIMPSSQNKNKIVVIGCRGVGKSEMVFKFLYNEIHYYYQLTHDKQQLEKELKKEVKKQSIIMESTVSNNNNGTNVERRQSTILSSSQSPRSNGPITLPTKVEQIIESEIDVDLKSNDSLEVRKLKLLLQKKNEEIVKQKKELDNMVQELSTMWKKERTEKLELEQDYVEQENELNRIRSVIHQIQQLVMLDPLTSDLQLPETMFSIKTPENPNNNLLTPNRKRKMTLNKSNMHNGSTSNVNGSVKRNSNNGMEIGALGTINSMTLNDNNGSKSNNFMSTPVHSNSHSSSLEGISSINPEEIIQSPLAHLKRKPRHQRTESAYQKLRTNQYQVVAQDLRQSIDEDGDESEASNVVDTREEELNSFLLEFNKIDKNANNNNLLAAPVGTNKVSTNSVSSDKEEGEDTDNDLSECSDIMSASSTASNANHLGTRDRSASNITANTIVLNTCGNRSKSPSVAASTDYKYDEKAFVKLLTPSFFLTEGLRLFNTGKPKVALRYLMDNGLLPDIDKQPTEDYNAEKPEAVIARFLAIADSLNKEKLGEFLSEPKNSVYLEEFVKFHVLELYKEEKEKPEDDTYFSKFDRAMRSFFIQFKLPKEGQQVTRIAEVFSQVYSDYNKNDGELNGNADACYLLVCSVLMVNTQLHNPNANIKLSRDQFVSLFTGFSDVNLNFIGTCYDSVARTAMVLYDEEIDKEDRTNFESDQQIELFFKCYKHPPHQVTTEICSNPYKSNRDHKSLSLDADKVKELTENSITFFFKAKVIHDGIINRVQIKDSDPNLELITETTENGNTKIKLKESSQIFSETKNGNYFICAYSVTDKTSFLTIEHVIKAIRKMKRKEKKKQIKKKSSKRHYSTLTGTLTEELLEQLNNDDSDYNNDKFMVLVACKADVPEDQRQVSKREGGELALKYSIPFFEVSNHDMYAVRQVFLNAIDSIKRQNVSYVDAVRQMSDFHQRLNIAKQNKKGQIDLDQLVKLPKCYI